MNELLDKAMWSGIKKRPLRLFSRCALHRRDIASRSKKYTQNIFGYVRIIFGA
jgi:hypothetical protein